MTISSISMTDTTNEIEEILKDNQCGLSENYPAQVLGDSMEPEFPDQCVVVIQPSDQAYNGAYVFAEVEGIRWFRQYVKDEEGERLVAVNSAIYPEINLEQLEWKILGVVIQRNIKRQIKHYQPKTTEDGVRVPLVMSK
jgi:phage repressor protein C with HTH and peptisase S24 domain